MPIAPGRVGLSSLNPWSGFRYGWCGKCRWVLGLENGRMRGKLCPWRMYEVERRLDRVEHYLKQMDGLQFQVVTTTLSRAVSHVTWYITSRVPALGPFIFILALYGRSATVLISEVRPTSSRGTWRPDAVYVHETCIEAGNQAVYEYVIYISQERVLTSIPS